MTGAWLTYSAGDSASLFLAWLQTRSVAQAAMNGQRIGAWTMVNASSPPDVIARAIESLRGIVGSWNVNIPAHAWTVEAAQAMFLESPASDHGRETGDSVGRKSAKTGARAQPESPTHFADPAALQSRNVELSNAVVKRWPSAKVRTRREPKTSRSWMVIDIKDGAKSATLFLTNTSWTNVQSIAPIDRCIEMIEAQLSGETIAADPTARRVELSDGEELNAMLEEARELF